MNRRRGLSVVRIGLIAGIVGIVIVAAGVASFFVDQSSRKSPYEVELYPGAEYWGMRDVQATSRDVFYRAADDAERVVGYYQQKMNEHYGDSVEHCVRVDSVVRASSRSESVVPFQVRCMFDRSGFGSTQYTLVLIYPGLPDPDPFYDAEGMTVIKYEQQWQP